MHENIKIVLAGTPGGVCGRFLSQYIQISRLHFVNPGDISEGSTDIPTLWSLTLYVISLNSATSQAGSPSVRLLCKRSIPEGYHEAIF